MAVTGGTRRIVGGVDTHKDLHVAAVVDEAGIPSSPASGSTAGRCLPKAPKPPV
jgi:hypothetical protein